MSDRPTRLAIAAGLSLGAYWVLYQAGCGDGDAARHDAAPVEAGVQDVGTDRPADRIVDHGDTSDVIGDAPAEDVVINTDAGWVTNPEGWTELTEDLDWLAPCRLWRGDLEVLDVPGLTWEPCGIGCERADLALGLAEGVKVASSGTMVGNIPLGHIVTGLKGNPPTSIAAQMRLDTGEVLAVHRFLHTVDNDGFLHCGIGSRDHPLFLGVSGPAADHGAIFVAHLTQPWLMLPDPVGTIGPSTYLDALPGLASNSPNAVVISLTLQPTAFQKIFDGWNASLTALGDQAVFVDWRGTGMSNGTFGKIQSWTPATGLQQLLAPDYDPFTVALSESRMVWVSVPEKLDYYPDATTMKPRFHWSPRTTTAAGMQPHDGAEIPNSPPRVDWELRTRGDYAAIVSASQQHVHDEWHTAVTNLDTGKLWMLKARRTEHIPITVWAVSDTHVYVAEGPDGMWRQDLIRYEIAQLDSLASQ